MQIDWLTVGAQVVNFLILVALLKRFLYGPVVEAMDRREARIVGKLREAEQREAEADARVRDFEERTADLDRRRQDLLEQARLDADTERRERLQTARTEVEHQRERWRLQLEQEWDDVRKALTRRLAGAVTATARRVLTDLADTELEQAVARSFRRRLAGLDEDARRTVEAGAGPVEIVTAFAPDATMRKTLSEAVREALGREGVFVLEDDLVGGIELRTDDWKMSWTIAEYLRDFEAHLAELIADTSHQVHG